MQEELGPLGFTVVTVAIDRDPEESRPWIERAAPTHPSLIDSSWLLADLYNIDQVPTVLWIDEEGRLVRPKDATFGSNTYIEFTGIDAATHRELLYEWVRDGKHLTADRVLAHLELPTDDDQLARAEFGLGRHLAERSRASSAEAAERHFDRAGELAPAQFTIRRGSMRMRGKDPMGAEFITMMTEWTNAGHPLNKPLPE